MVRERIDDSSRKRNNSKYEVLKPPLMAFEDGGRGGHKSRNLEEAIDTRNNPQLTSSKEAGTSVLQHKELKSAKTQIRKKKNGYPERMSLLSLESLLLLYSGNISCPQIYFV